jgi:SAM-dependent methyltransferase
MTLPMRTRSTQIAKGNRRPRETNYSVLRQAMLRRLSRRIGGKGEIRLPCAPGLLDHYMKLFTTLFETLGKPFTADEAEQLKNIVERKLTEGFRISPYSQMLLVYETKSPPHPGIAYTVSTVLSSTKEQFDRWVAEREPPLFGKHADMKVLHVAEQLGPPERAAILDAGAGTGRNTLPLAKLGFAADAVELAPTFAKVIRDTAQAEGLTVNVFEGDILDPALPLPLAHYNLIVLAEVVSHFRDIEQLRSLLVRASDLLVPGGFLLFSAFLALDGYKPDGVARELSEITWSSLFTRTEVSTALEGLPLDRLSEESVFEYEQAHLPADAWPPTGWFTQWAQGGDIFALPEGKAPAELRWILCRKRE